MKKILIFLLIAFSCNAQQNNESYITLLENLQHQAQEAIWHKNNFSPAELQFLLNYCCAAYALVFTELKLLEETQFVLPMAWHLRFNNEEPIITADNIQTMQCSLQRIQEFLHARSIIRDALDTFNQELNGSTYGQLLGILDLIAHDGSDFITTLVASQQETLQTDLIASKEVLKEISDTLATTRESCAVLSYKSCQCSDETTALEMVNSTQELIATLGQEAKKMLDTSVVMTNDVKELQQKSALVFYTYYCVLYDGMKKRNLDQRYFTMLFAENCIIAPDPASKGLIEPILDRTLPFFQNAEFKNNTL